MAGAIRGHCQHPPHQRDGQAGQVRTARFPVGLYLHSHGKAGSRPIPQYGLDRHYCERRLLGGWAWIFTGTVGFPQTIPSRCDRACGDENPPRPPMFQLQSCPSLCSRLGVVKSHLVLRL